jgi:hypothetical protein
LLNICNYDGYDRQAALASFEKEKAEFQAAVAARGTENKLSVWAIIFNTDALMCDNNLMEYSVQSGTDLELNQVRIVRVVESVARLCLENVVDSLWVLRFHGGQAILSCGDGERETFFFAWEKEEDARRFALNLAEDGRGRTNPELMRIVDLKDSCIRQNALIGFVAPSFVQPSHFPGGSA